MIDNPVVHITERARGITIMTVLIEGTIGKLEIHISKVFNRSWCHPGEQSYSYLVFFLLSVFWQSSVVFCCLTGFWHLSSLSPSFLSSDACLSATIVSSFDKSCSKWWRLYCTQKRATAAFFHGPNKREFAIFVGVLTSPLTVMKIHEEPLYPIYEEEEEEIQYHFLRICCATICVGYSIFAELRKCAVVMF